MARQVKGSSALNIKRLINSVVKGSKEAKSTTIETAVKINRNIAKPLSLREKETGSDKNRWGNYKS
jgi:hypothetical protein